MQNFVNKNNLQDTDVSTENISSSTATACSSKFIDIEMVPPASLSVPTTASSPISGYWLIDMLILADVFTLLSCPGGHSIQCLKLSDIKGKKRFGKKFATYAWRQVGAGHENLRKVCFCLNIPEPMLSNNYHNIWLKVKEFTKSISIVTSQLRGAVDSVDVGVSLDGTWQRKGSTSLNGGITAVSIDKGKFLDTIILFKSCKGCTRMQTIKDKDPHAYDKWNSAHKCSLNYKRLYLLQWKKWVVKKYSSSQ